jgi:hypothetical protein
MPMQQHLALSAKLFITVLVFLLQSRMTTFTEADRRKILESLTSDELATFQEAFTVFDKNHDGTITTKVTFL